MATTMEHLMADPERENADAAMVKIQCVQRATQPPAARTATR